jgi:Nucleotidyltransferase domain
MCADEVRPLLDRFTADAGRAVPLEALWAHGSLALGDCQPGRSDLDLVALVSTTIRRPQRDGLKRVHEELIRELPLADNLHCSYVPRAELSDAGFLARTYVRAQIERVLELPGGAGG